MRIASMVYTCASVAVIRAFAGGSRQSMSMTPVLFLVLLVSPARIQVLEVAPIVVVVDCVMDLRVNFSDTECPRAKLHSFRSPGAASLSDVIEVLAAHFEVLDPEAIAVLPGVLDLMVAQPCLAVERAFLVFLVQGSDIVPAGVVRVGSHDAFMREIVEIRGVDGLHQVALNTEHLAVEKSYEVGVADLEDVVTRVIVDMDIGTSSPHDCWNIVLTDKSVSSFEAPTSTEGVHNIVNTENHVAKDAMLWPDIMFSQSVDVHCLLWADNAVVDLYALSKEELVKFINFIADTEHALVIPEMIEVITANPFPYVLVLIPQVCLEARARG